MSNENVTLGVDIHKTPESSVFKKEPTLNVISKEEFENRVGKVFHLLWETLAKSFGPYGAPTIICNYPFRHITKDGYTIMKNLSFNAAETQVDQAIADMAGDICGRLNYSVGDGTTSAIIATNSIYQNYRALKDELTNNYILPRDVMKKFNIIKSRVIEKMGEKVIPINTDDPEQLYKNIYEVVYISSNGDELITDYIADLYKELGIPGISCIKAPDGITSKKLIKGYNYELSLNDRLYINNDEKTMSVSNADVIVFGTKITETTYTKILKPLNQECAMRGRNLIVAAPSYDEKALQQVIAPELNAEFRKMHSVNMVLTTYRAISAHTRRLVNDFAILMNTEIIDRVKEKEILDQLATGKGIHQVINIDNRQIEGLRCVAISDQEQPASYVYGVDELPENFRTISDFLPMEENAVHLGFVREASLGLQKSLFTELCYDEARYEVALNEAKDLLEEAERKYQKLGTFNIEVRQCQERYYALKLKMGIIEVGGDSDMSQQLLKDAVDDAVRAAESAYKYGVVQGCNMNLTQSIQEVYHDTEDEIDKILLNILMNGFIDVYKTVLSNAFTNVEFQIGDTAVNDIKNYITNHFGPVNEIFVDEDALNNTITSFNKSESGKLTLHDILIGYSLLTNSVFDVSSFSYSNRVINSLQTDTEILTATIDLIAILITGNQMVVTQKHNFED